MWSGPKVKEFCSIVTNAVGSSRHLAVLLYGPSGCGKLVTPPILIRDVCSNPPAISTVFAFHHMGESLTRPVEELDRFFSGAGSSSWALSVGSSSPPSPQLVVRVVKLMNFDEGERDDSSASLRASLWRCLERSMKTIECLDDGTQTTTMQFGGHAFSASLTLFVHTVHDTHSDKVNLNAHFSDVFLRSPSMIKFHCTSITPRAIKLRLLRVLASRDGPSSSFSKSSKRGREGNDAPHHRTNAGAVDRISLTSSGDIRQALLQLQWASIPIGATDSEVVDHPSREALSANSERKKSTIEDLLCGSEGNCLQENDLENASGGAATIVRDEYIDVAHGAARLLTQKYAAKDVMSSLTVPSHKMLGYFASNLHHYFGDEQTEAYALCAELLSSVEKMMLPSELLDVRGGGTTLDDTQATRSHRAAHEVSPNALASAGMELLQRGYCVYHKDVVVPKTFLSQRPPPYLPSCFPKISTVQRQWRPRCTFPRFLQRDSTFNDAESYESQDSGTKNTESILDEFRVRMRAVVSAVERPLSLLPVADILREVLSDNRVGSLSDALLDTVPLMLWIVLDGPHRRSRCGRLADESTPAVVRKESPRIEQVPVIAPLGTKKTMFSFGAAAASSQVIRPRDVIGTRCVSILQDELLLQAAPCITGLTSGLWRRRPCFAVGAQSSLQGADTEEEDDPIEDA